MTCIVGLVHKGEVWMGGDSAAAGDWEIRISSQPKVFEVRGMLIGITGSWRMAQLLQFHLPDTLEEWDGKEGRVPQTDIMHYLVRSFIPAARLLFKEEGYAREDSNEQSHDGSFLVGLHGRLFEVHTNYQVNEWVDGYTAFGVASRYALGSMFRDGDSVQPDVRIENALEAAAYFSNGVERPFHILSLKKR